MASLKIVLLMSFCQTLSASADQQTQHKTAHPGDTVTLSCHAPKPSIAAVEWTRTDLEKYVYFQRGRRPLTQDQDPHYVDRVELHNPEMKNGDLSLTLKTVNSNDSGRYECRYKEFQSKRRKRAAINNEPIRIFVLNVNDETPGNTESGKHMHGHYGIIIPLLALLIVGVVGVVGVVVLRKAKGHLNDNSDRPVVKTGLLQKPQEKENIEEIIQV